MQGLIENGESGYTISSRLHLDMPRSRSSCILSHDGWEQSSWKVGLFVWMGG